MTRTVLVLGATSLMAQETQRHFADRGDRLILVARDAEKLGQVAQDLRARGATVDEVVADLGDPAAAEGLVRALFERAPRLDVALVAHGVLGEQERAARDWSHAEELLRVNFTSPAALLTALANRFEAQRGGTIAVISSVAGDRGRASNYVYGSAKAGLTAFLSGLRNRLHKAGVAVVTINPGFVATPMTAHLKKGPLVAEAAPVGAAIYRAIDKRRDVAYVPFFWRYVMMVIRAIPEALFKRLSL